MSFTENLNYCMNQRKYSAYRLSRLIGSTNQAVLNWQKGKSIPHYKTREKIAGIFGITVEELDGDSLPTVSSQINLILEFPQIEKGRPADGKAANVLDLSDLSVENREKLKDYFALLLNSQER